MARKRLNMAVVGTMADAIPMLADEIHNAPDRPMDYVVLLPRQEAFAQGIAKGLTQGQAAIEAGYSPASAQVSGCLLAKKPKVRARIQQLRRLAIDHVEDVREDHLKQLMLLRELAKTKGQVAAAIKAEELRGKVLGLYVEQSVRVGVNGQMPTEDANPRELKTAIAEAIQRLGLIEDRKTIDATVTRTD